MIGGCTKSRCICYAYGESEENDKNIISHTVTRVKVIKVKKFEKETKNQNPISPTFAQNQPFQLPKVCNNHCSFCPGSLSPSLDYLIYQCLMLFNEPKDIASMLGKLWRSKNHWSYVLYWQFKLPLIWWRMSTKLLIKMSEIALLYPSLSLEDQLLAPSVHDFQL